MQIVSMIAAPVLVASLTAYLLWLATRFVIAIENIAIIMAKATDPDLANMLIRGGAKKPHR